MLVECVIQKIQAAAALYLKADGSIVIPFCQEKYCQAKLLVYGRKKTKSSCAGTTGLTLYPLFFAEFVEP